MRLDLLEHLGLDGRVLEDCLDYELGACGIRRVGGRRDPVKQRLRFLLGGATSRDCLLDQLLRVLLAVPGGDRRDVLEHDLQPRLGTDVGDRGAHHARAEHDDLLRGERFDPLGTVAIAVDALHVEEERLNHVLGDLTGHEVDEVAALDLDRVVEVELGALHGRGHDVVRSGVVGALELLAQVGRERRQVLRELGIGRRAAGDLVALGVPRLHRRVRVGLDPSLRGGDQLLARCHELVDDPELLGLGGTVTLALQQQRQQRVGDAEHPHRTHDAASAGQQPKLNLGEAELDRWVVERDPVVAREADLEAAAQRGAVDRGDDRLAERLEAPQHRLALAHELRDLLGLVPGGLAQVVQVSAGEECLLGRGDDDTGDLVLLRLEPVDGRPDRRRVGGVHRVGRLVGVVQRQDDDPILVLVPPDR